MIDREKIQEKEYEFPYHHLPVNDEQNWHLGKWWFNGLEYLGVLTYVKNIINDLNPKNVLDFGCGDGMLLYFFKKNGNNYLFVEDFSFVKNIGVISCYELNNKNCNFLGQVIKEKFHLSFPFIFEFENQIYMCPETHEQKEIRLYHCLDFPKKWEYKMTLIKNILAVDTLIFAKNDIWWMLTNTSKTDTKDFCELSIFYSKKGPLTDKWIAHKSNPIYVDPCLARNGGILFKKNKIYRVNQKNGFNFYGKEFDINEILTINVDTYNEKLISNVKPNFLKNIVKGKIDKYDKCS